MSNNVVLDKEDLRILKDNIFEHLRYSNGEKISDTSMRTILGPLVLKSYDGALLEFETDNKINKLNINQKFIHPLLAAAEEYFGFPVDVVVFLPDEKRPLHVAQYHNEAPVRNMNIFSFENFYPGPTNTMAFTAAMAVAQNPGRIHNPLFIYGGSGLGKTHLLKAIKYELEKNSQLNVIYTSGENFLNEVYLNIQSKTMAEFHNKYREDADVLLVDDVQFLGKTETAQEELSYTFEALIQKNKQIVFVSDRPPKEIPKLENRLRSRCEQGLLADIQPPNLENRIVIIKKKAADYNLVIPDTPDNNVVAYMAERLQNNVRQIEGVLHKLSATVSVENDIEITKKLVNSIIQDVVYFANNTEVVVDNVIEKVSNQMNVSRDEILSQKKDKQISKARQMAMYIIKNVTPLTYKEIGIELGGKTHSTVIHGYNEIEELMMNDSEIKAIITDIIESIRTENIY